MASVRKIPKPQAGEFAPYTTMYIDLVPDDELVLQHIQDIIPTMKDLIQSFTDEQLSTPHAEGEWTIKEILVHVLDTERVFAYRALRIARNDFTALPGFEQNDYVPYSQANERTTDSLLEEYEALRRATITLFKNLLEETFTRQGTGGGYPLSVRAAIYQIAGHELHHIKSIRENYL